MAKINFSKVEKSFDNAVQRLFIENLTELGAIANMVQDSQVPTSSHAIEEVIAKFQKQLKKIKEQDLLMFNKLNLTPEEEQRFYLPSTEYTQQDWLRLKEFKQRIEELKRELCGQETINPDHDDQITKERRRHVNKRFNVRDGWLPLH